ncbi:MAG: site-specific DNA-methyltransferase [Nitrospira sp.]|nr:site-specific DNA-methyltransferase [Nitrospira sp.]
MAEKVQIGNAELWHGDCREVLPLLRGVDAIVSDPPYGIALRNGDVDGHRSARSFEIAGDDTQDVGIAVLQWAEARQCPTVLFASPWKPWPGEWRNLIVWNKGGAVGGGGDIKTCAKRTWELVQVARNGAMHGPRAESVWHFPIVPADTADHICAKPVRLMERLVRTFTTGAVCDPCMGSGSTGVAAARLGRRFVGVEIDRRYFDIACERIENEQRQFRIAV